MIQKIIFFGILFCFHPLSNICAEQKTVIDFEGASIRGEVKSPTELSFQSKKTRGSHSLLERRKHFHSQLVREIVLGP